MNGFASDLADGFVPLLEQTKLEDDDDLVTQIEVFYGLEQHDEAEFLQNFDKDDPQAVRQAIELQVGSISSP